MKKKRRPLKKFIRCISKLNQALYLVIMFFCAAYLESFEAFKINLSERSYLSWLRNHYSKIKLDAFIRLYVPTYMHGVMFGC